MKYIVYKITNKTNGEYYIGKEVYKPLEQIIKGYENSVNSSTNWHKGSLRDYIKTQGFENFIFEEIDTLNEFIWKKELFERYLKDETNPELMIYYDQREYVENNIKNNEND